jgi:hypothetical protein
VPSDELAPRPDPAVIPAAPVSPPVRPRRLASEDVVVSAPMSFAGSAVRIWKLTRETDNFWGQIALGALAVTLIGMAWTVSAARKRERCGATSQGPSSRSGSGCREPTRARSSATRLRAAARDVRSPASR